MNINIYEYIYYYFLMDEEVLPLLISYFRPIVYNMIKSMGLMDTPNGGNVELLSVADVTLINCIQSYREDQGVHFYTYYKRSIKNQYYSHYRKLYRMPVVSMSLDAKIHETARYEYSDICQDDTSIDLHNHVLLCLELSELEQEIQKQLKPIDCEIYNLLKQGYSYRDIADTLDIRYAKVKYHIKKIRNLLVLIDKTFN